MNREEAIKTIMSATVWTDEEREALSILVPELRESEDDKIKRTISDILHFDNEEIREILKYRNLTYTQVWDYLERQKEQTSAGEILIRDEGEPACSYLERCLSPDMRKIWYEACKEMKEKFTPVDNVFGFKIGDKVRLMDGDGRPHIIKEFKRITGLHGPDFYQVIFEDDSAVDHIIPDDKCQGGYFTCMEKIPEYEN